jgi:hypothetical protein
MVKPHCIFFYVLFVSCAGLLKGQTVNYVMTDSVHVKYSVIQGDTGYFVRHTFRKPGEFCIYIDSSFTQKMHEINFGTAKSPNSTFELTDTTFFWYRNGKLKEKKFYRPQIKIDQRWPSGFDYYPSGTIRMRYYLVNDSLYKWIKFFPSGEICEIDHNTITEKSLEPTDLRWTNHESYCQNGQRKLQINPNSYTLQKITEYDCDGNVTRKYSKLIMVTGGFTRNFIQMENWLLKVIMRRLKTISANKKVACGKLIIPTAKKQKKNTTKKAN